MDISVINTSDVPGQEVQQALDAVNEQIAKDFEKPWNLSGQLSLVAKEPKKPEAVLYIKNKTDSGDYHWDPDGTPIAKVYTDVPPWLLERAPWVCWTVALSHEVLEMLADPELKTTVNGPHPDEPEREVEYWHEICDPVQSEMYEIGGVKVCNFVLPSYYEVDGGNEGKHDFLGNGVKPFRWNENGEIGFYDPKCDKYVIYPQYPLDHPVIMKHEVKGKTRRLHRYPIQHKRRAAK